MSAPSSQIYGTFRVRAYLRAAAGGRPSGHRACSARRPRTGPATDRCYTVRVLVAENIVLRPYEPEDEEFIALLSHEAFDEFTPRAVPHTLDMVQRFHTLVALRGGHRVGFLTLSGRPGDVFMVQAIAISARHRGRGIG